MDTIFKDPQIKFLENLKDPEKSGIHYNVFIKGVQPNQSAGFKAISPQPLFKAIAKAIGNYLDSSDSRETHKITLSKTQNSSNIYENHTNRRNSQR